MQATSYYTLFEYYPCCAIPWVYPSRATPTIPKDGACVGTHGDLDRVHPWQAHTSSTPLLNLMGASEGFHVSKALTTRIVVSTGPCART